MEYTSFQGKKKKKGSKRALCTGKKSPGLPRTQDEMFCAIRAMIREQSPQERGNKEKLLLVPLADQTSAENLISPETKHLPKKL